MFLHHVIVRVVEAVQVWLVFQACRVFPALAEEAEEGVEAGEDLMTEIKSTEKSTKSNNNHLGACNCHPHINCQKLPT